MKVIIAKTAGFCRGVKRAVEKAQEAARTSGPPVHTDGPLIHNEQVMDRLRAEGIRATDHPETVRDGVLLIRAHGISAERRAMLRRLPVPVMDATCPDVSRIQGLIKKHAAKGFYTIIFGDPGHAEVAGLLGYTQGRGFVVSRVEDVAALPEISPVCLCAQSTQFPDDYEAIAMAVRRRFNSVVVLDTICDATRNRQTELLEIAAIADAIVVVGSEHSANTRRLAQLAATLRPTFHIQTPDQLKPADFREFKTVGVTAGASTPDFIIEDVKKTLEAI